AWSAAESLAARMCSRSVVSRIWPQTAEKLAVEVITAASTRPSPSAISKRPMRPSGRFQRNVSNFIKTARPFPADIHRMDVLLCLYAGGAENFSASPLYGAGHHAGASPGGTLYVHLAVLFPQG